MLKKWLNKDGMPSGTCFSHHLIENAKKKNLKKKNKNKGDCRSGAFKIESAYMFLYLQLCM